MAVAAVVTVETKGITNGKPKQKIKQIVPHRTIIKQKAKENVEFAVKKVSFALCTRFIFIFGSILGHIRTKCPNK